MRSQCTRTFLLILYMSAWCFPAHAYLRTIQQTRKALQEIEIGDPDTIVPPRVRPLLTELKHQLRDHITESLNSNLSLDHLQDPEKLQDILISELEHRSVRFEDAVDDQHPYGAVIDITVERPEGQSQILAITSSISIPYGDDTSLYLYERDGMSWRLILALEENDYAEISSAQYGLLYAVSPADENESIFVATVHTTAWPVSNWQGLDFKVVRPQPDPYTPLVLLKQSEGVFLAVDTPYKLTASKDSVTLVFQSHSFDYSILVRPRIMKFQIKGDHAKRIDPMAFDAQGFLEEWISQPWKEVVMWPHSKVLGNAEAWQTLLHDAQNSYSTEFGFVQSCGNESNRWQIKLDFDFFTDVKTPQYLLPESLYFVVIKSGSNYFIRSIDVNPLQDCPGNQAARTDYDLDRM
jgi:hypothetical protein